MRKLTFAAMAVVLMGCATGTALITGQARPAIPIEQVKLYSEPPAQYEVIGLVSGNSSAGWTPQKSLDMAVEEMRRRAGSMGANGVLVESSGSSGSSGGVIIGSVFVMDDGTYNQTVTGRAIYVPN